MRRYSRRSTTKPKNPPPNLQFRTVCVVVEYLYNLKMSDKNKSKKPVPVEEEDGSEESEVEESGSGSGSASGSGSDDESGSESGSGGEQPTLKGFYSLYYSMAEILTVVLLTNRPIQWEVRRRRRRRRRRFRRLA